MSKQMTKVLLVVVAVIVVIWVVAGIASEEGTAVTSENYTNYRCDVKNLRLSTTIDIYKEGEQFAKVSGNILRFVTDPLTLYDWNGAKLGYAGDDYHFIAQDSHSIYVENAMTVEMVGLFKWVGQAYDIYNVEGCKIATAEFNSFNTRGYVQDMNGNLIADYHSNFFFNDFDVRIFKNCELDENTVLLIFSSYYSDQHADSSN